MSRMCCSKTNSNLVFLSLSRGLSGCVYVIIKGQRERSSQQILDSHTVDAAVWIPDDFLMKLAALTVCNNQLILYVWCHTTQSWMVMRSGFFSVWLRDKYLHHLMSSTARHTPDILLIRSCHSMSAALGCCGKSDSSGIRFIMTPGPAVCAAWCPSHRCCKT